MVNDTTNRDHQLGDIGTKVFNIAGVIGLAAIASSFLIAAFSHDWEGFGRSYLVAFMFVLSLSLGALFFTALHHAVHAGWSVVLRRFAECVAANLTWLWVLFLPVVGCMIWSDLYHWRHPEADDAILQGKKAFLNPGLWMILAVVYFALWAMFADSPVSVPTAVGEQLAARGRPRTPRDGVFGQFRIDPSRSAVKLHGMPRLFSIGIGGL